MSKSSIALGIILMGLWRTGVCAESSVPLTVLNFQLTCDSDQCRTAVLEVHENTGIDANHVVYIFAAPPGITFDDAHTTGVEVDGSGDTHYVRASNAGDEVA